MYLLYVHYYFVRMSICTVVLCCVYWTESTKSVYYVQSNIYIYIYIYIYIKRERERRERRDRGKGDQEI